MSGKKRKSRLTGALMALLGAACALILCAVFYGTMVYQLSDRTDNAQAKWKAKAASAFKWAGSCATC